MKTILRFRSFARLIALLLVLLPAILAGPQRSLRPIRVVVRAPDNNVNMNMASAVQAELRKLRDVVITERNADYEIRMNALRAASETCAGYSVAVQVVERGSGREVLDSYIGATPQKVAAQIVAAADQEYFAPRRAAAK